ncbi:MAG: c-type cytochrome [Myxococcaceae bacterium]|nr:c-type cytochrome [Myxococcaceae bacterium]
MRRALVLAAALLAGCAPTAQSYGEQLFNDPQFAGSKFNAWSCATCHAVRSGDARILTGHPMPGLFQRSATWGGALPRPIDAASFCYVAFMRGPGALSPDEPHSKALSAYLQSLPAAAPSGPLPFTVVANVVDVAPGDAVRGKAVYQQACQACHGEPHTGNGRNSTLATILPDVQDDYASVFPGVKPTLVFVEKIRHGQFLGIGGNMPPFSQEVLSDDDLGALLGYLGVR